MPTENRNKSNKEEKNEIKNEHSNPGSNKSLAEDDDDISSLCTLKAELSDYLQRTESYVFHELYPGVEMINYDFTVERHHLYSTNMVESTAHLIKGCLGAGVLGIHEGYMYGGLWTSLVGNLVIGVMVSHCMMMVVKSAQKMYGRLRVPRLSYPDLIEAAVATGPMKSCRKYSKVLRYFLELLLFVEFNGTCCIFMIMIADTLKQVLEAFSETMANLQIPIRLYILIITVPVLALCLIRSLKYLASFAIVADIIIAICVVVAIYYSISVAKDIHDRPAWKSVHGLFRFCGVCLYSIDGVGVTLPVENHMRRPQYFATVLQCAMCIVIPFVMIIGFCGYWAWGDDSHSPITSHMVASLFPCILQCLLTVSLAVTFAIHFWVPFRIIWHYLGQRYKKRRVLWERIYRTTHVLTIACLSIAFPHLSRLMALMGSFLLAFLVFVFPAIIETFVTWMEPRHGYVRYILVKNILLLLFGITVCIGTFITYS